MGKTLISYTFEPTAEMVALKPECVDEDLHIQVPKNNYVARLVVKPGFEENLNFFKNHNIVTTLTKSSSTIYPKVLCEFWYTCSHSIVNNVSVISWYIDLSKINNPLFGFITEGRGSKELESFKPRTTRMV